MLGAAGVVGYRYYVASKSSPIVYQGDDERITNMIREKGGHDVLEWLFHALCHGYFGIYIVVWPIALDRTILHSGKQQHHNLKENQNCV